MKKLTQKLNIIKTEWRFVAYLILVITLLTTLPYLYAHFSASPDKIYNGLHSLTIGDVHVYFSYLEQVNQGNYLFKNLFTSEITMPVLNIFWLGAGLLGKLFNLGHILTFHLARILLIPICIISAYLLISYFFNSKLVRKITLAFLLFSSGFGALASIVLPSYVDNQTLFYWPMDLWVPEYNLFLTLYHSPHLIASLTLIILIFLFFLKAIDENNTRYSILAGICGLILIQFHPFHLPTIWLIPAIYVLSQILKETISAKGAKLPIGSLAPSIHSIWQKLKHLIILFTLTAPSVLYYIWLMNVDWSTKLKAIQNVCFTPRFFIILISYGGLLLFGLIPIIIYLIKPSWIQDTRYKILDTNKLQFLIIWASTQFILIFLPFSFQRRLTEGLQIPLVFLTIIAILWLKNILQDKFKNLELDKLFFNKYLLITIFLFGFALSNWFVVELDIKRFANNDELFYYNKQQLESYQWLKHHSTADEVILANLPNGNFIPGAIGRKVYFGHVDVETLYYEKKLANLEWFFEDNKNDGEKIKFLLENNIKYIYYSQYEKDLGDFEPNNKDYLNNIYSNNFATIYKFLNS
jgi:hypothetical protein